jgi:ADP-heptose:LPS heptosyltransferase
VCNPCRSFGSAAMGAATESPASVRSMLMIHQGAIGDFILALPALTTLRQSFPDSRLVLLGYPNILELVKDRFRAEDILSIDRSGMASFYVKEGPLDPDLSNLFSRFDLIIVCARDRDGILTGNLGRVCQARLLHLNPFPPEGEGVHVIDHLTKQLSGKGFRTENGSPKLFLSASDRKWADGFWEREGLNRKERKNVIVVHPGSGGRRKVWPVERFIRVGEYVTERFGLRILLVIGPAEPDGVRKSFCQMKGPQPAMAENLPLVHLASVMEGSGLFLGNDSGMSHLAAALGIPAVVIFGPTDPRTWSPKGEKVVVLREEAACSPCSRERLLGCGTLDCLTRIDENKVQKALEEMWLST